MAQLTAGQDTRAGAGRGESGLGKLLEGGVEWSGVEWGHWSEQGRKQDHYYSTLLHY